MCSCDVFLGMLLTRTEVHLITQGVVPIHTHERVQLESKEAHLLGLNILVANQLLHLDITTLASLLRALYVITLNLSRMGLLRYHLILSHSESWSSVEGDCSVAVDRG